MYNRAAQQNFQRRLQLMLTGHQMPRVRTFHALGLRLYQRLIQAGVLPPTSLSPMVETAVTEKADPRETILKAAAERILHYGYNKTTMSEIAADCGMSAGNIYRFYPSKIDIAEAMTRNFSAESHAVYANIIRDSAKSPSSKLSGFFQYRLERTFRLFEKHPKLMELAEIMGRERPEYLAEERAQERMHIERILDDGVKSGDFARQDDITITAEAPNYTGI